MANARARRKPAEHADPATRAAVYMLEDQVGFLLRCAHQRATEIFNAVMARFGVTPTQFAALAKLDDLGSVSQNQLGRLTRMDPATISGVVGRLIARGYVRQSTDIKDARLVMLMLTPVGAGRRHGHEGGSRPRCRGARWRRSTPAEADRAAQGARQDRVTRCSPPAVIQQLDRRAPAPVARADRRGAEGLGAAAGGARGLCGCGRALPGDPAGAVRRAGRAARADATSGPRVDGPGGAAHGRGLPALRRRVRHADGGGRRRRGRRAAGAHDAPPRRWSAPSSTTAATSPCWSRPAMRSTSASPASSRAAPCRRSTARSASMPASGVGGIATSGARGRSFSLGIADSVTVLGARRGDRRRRGDADRQCGRRRQPGRPPPPRARARPRQRPARPAGDGIGRRRSSPPRSTPPWPAASSARSTIAGAA